MDPVSPRLKTKTLVKTLTSMKMIPAGTETDEFASADVLPEAILVKNILEETLRSMETLFALRYCLE